MLHFIDINECLNNPCKNQGTCSNNVGGFTCTCKSGWRGKLCENGKLLRNKWVNQKSVSCISYASPSDVDECANNPCKNNGICTNKEGVYSCTCLAGWQGQHCELGNSSNIPTEKNVTTLYILCCSRQSCFLLLKSLFCGAILHDYKYR